MCPKSARIEPGIGYGIAAGETIRFIAVMTVAVLKSCVLAARPKTLPAALVPVWLGCVLAWKLSGVFDPWLAMATLFGALAIQLATNFFNDAIDASKGADTVRRLGPVRVTAAGLLRPQTVMRLAVGFLAVALGCGIVLYQARGWPLVVIGVPSLFLAYGYTGGPFPLAYRGLGEVFVILFFGLIAVAGTVFIQTGGWPVAALLLGLQSGLLSAVLISINNFRDRAEDATTGKRTLAVRGGPQVAAAVIWLEIIMAAVAGVGWLVMGQAALGVASVPVVVIGWWIIRVVRTLPPGPVCNRLLALGGVQLLLFAGVFHAAAAWLG